MKDNLEKMIEASRWMSETMEKIYQHTDDFIIEFEPNTCYQDIDNISFDSRKITIVYLTDDYTRYDKSYSMIDISYWLEELN